MRRTGLVLLGIGLSLLPGATAQTDPHITTVAGGGPHQMSASSANLASPNWLTADASGNVYISDEFLARLFKVEPGGALSILAGTGVPIDQPPGDGGPAVDASLLRPRGAAVDSAGDVHIVDRDGHRVRRIDAMTGIISTIVGNGNLTHSIDGPGGDPADDLGDGGPAVDATMSDPGGIAIDSAGNLYLADNQRIRRVDALSGIIETIAGGGSNSPGDGGDALEAELSGPTSVIVDGSGDVFLAEEGGNRVRRVDGTSGIITTFAGTGQYTGSLDGEGGDPSDDLGDGGAATTATFSTPSGIALGSAGDLYIADRDNDRVRRVDAATGNISTVAGVGTRGFSGDGGPATLAQLTFPTGLALESSGDLLIGDGENFRVRRVAAATGIITTFAGNGSDVFSGEGVPARNASLGFPHDVAYDGVGSLLIPDFGSSRVRRVDLSSGLITTIAGTGVDLDSLDGPGGDPSDDLGEGGPAVGASVTLPTAVASDASGNVFVADRRARIRRVDASTGIITTVAGSGVFGFSGDGGPATDAWIRVVEGMVVDGAGNLFFSDTESHRVRVVSAGSNIIRTYAGNGVAGFGGDLGTATFASLRSPTALGLDADGNLYIADTGNSRVRKVFASNGGIVTVAGNGIGGASEDGLPATDASLFHPRGVAVDDAGNIFISDSLSFRVRRVDAASGILTTVAGDGSPGFNGDGGPAILASLGFPEGLAASGDGRLWFVDRGANRIRHVAPMALPPIAEAGADRMVACTSLAGAIVTLDGSGSSSPSGAPLSYTWTGPFPEGGGIAAGVAPPVTLPLGRSEIALVVNDGVTDSAANTVVVTVALGVRGLLPPLANLVAEGQTPPLPKKPFRQSLTLMLRLELLCGSMPLGDRDIAPPRLMSLTRDGQPVALLPLRLIRTRSDGNGLEFSFSSDGTWGYRLSTRGMSAGEYQATIETPDGLRYIGAFALR